MEKVRLIETAWYDDFLNNKYINDLAADLNKSRGIGDACANTEEVLPQPKTNVKDENGIIHVQPACEQTQLDKNDKNGTCVKPRGRYLVPFQENASKLPNVSV